MLYTRNISTVYALCSLLFILYVLSPVCFDRCMLYMLSVLCMLYALYSQYALFPVCHVCSMPFALYGVWSMLYAV